jgi:hypothetical protein
MENELLLFHCSMVVWTHHIFALYIFCSNDFFRYFFLGNFTMLLDKAMTTTHPSFTNGRYIEWSVVWDSDSTKQLPSYRARSATLPRSETLPTPTTGHYTICCKKKSQSCAPKDRKKFARNIGLILEINKTVIVASRWFSILLYLKHSLSYVSTHPLTIKSGIRNQTLNLVAFMYVADLRQEFEHYTLA